MENKRNEFFNNIVYINISKNNIIYLKKIKILIYNY